MSAPFMQLYVADYLGDTRHLTTEQHGAYLLLLMTMWRSDGRLPNDVKKLARITGCTASRWARIADEVLAFFEVDGDTLTNKRLMLELEKASEKSIQRAAAGTKGGHAKALKDNKPALANASRLPCHSSEPEPEKKELSTNVERRAPVLVKGGHTLPEGWSPDPDDFLKALDLIGADRAATELEKFTDYWRAVPGAKGRKLDWSATYRNWIRRTAESAPRNDRPAPDHRADARSVWADIIAESASPRTGPVEPLRLAG